MCGRSIFDYWLRGDIINNIFGCSGLAFAEDSFEFDTKSQEIIDKLPECAPYFNQRLKDRLREHVTIPRIQLKHDRLWTNNKCESINHVFIKVSDWKPEPLPQLVSSLHDVVKLHFADLKRAIYGTGNYELLGRYRHYAVSQQCWYSKTEDQKFNMYKRLLNDSKSSDKAVVHSTDVKFDIPLPQKLARKPNQRKRPRTNRTQPRY